MPELIEKVCGVSEARECPECEGSGSDRTGVCQELDRHGRELLTRGSGSTAQWFLRGEA